VFQLSAVYACLAYKDAVTEIMPYVDIVFGNRYEARAYADANNLAMDDIADIACQMARRPKANGRRGRLVVITCDSQPTVVVDKGVVTRYICIVTCVCDAVVMRSVASVSASVSLACNSSMFDL